MSEEQRCDVDVVIIGGGLAGLTSAVALVQAGLEVIVVERDAILGGRASSWTDEVTGDPVHIGPHIFLSQYPNFLKLQRTVGALGSIVWQEKDLFIHLVDGRDVVDIRSSGASAPYHYARSLIRDPALSFADVSSNWPAIQLAVELTEERVLELDMVNAYSFLRSLGVSERFIRRFWAFLANSLLNLPIEMASAGYLMRVFRLVIGRSDLSIGFPDGGLGDTFAPQCRRYIEERGGRVLLEAEVSTFLGDDHDVVGVELTDGRRIEARRTIAAIPPMALRRLCRPAWIKRHQTFADLVTFQEVPYKCIYLWFDRKLTDLMFWSRFYDPNDLNCDFYDMSNITRGWGNRNSLICSNIIWSHRTAGMTDEELVAGTLDELAEFIPEAREANLVHSRVHHVPHVIHAPVPGMERRRPPVSTPIGGLTIAGDWIATRFPSTMESAVKAGWMAAEDVLASMDRPRELAIEHPDIQGVARFLRAARHFMPNRKDPRWLKALKGD